MPTQDQFERYAMRLGETTQQDHKWANVDAVGADLGFTPEESRKLASWLEDEDWATTMASREGLKIRLRKYGIDEIAKLYRPRYQKWIERHPRWWFAITWALATAGGVLIGESLKRLLWP